MDNREPKVIMMSRELKVWGYCPMLYIDKMYEARPIGTNKVHIKAVNHRYPDRMDIVAYVWLPNRQEYLAVRTTYKGKLYGPYRVPNYEEFKGETGFLEKTSDVDLPIELVTAIKARMAEYIEWRIVQYNHGKHPSIAIMDKIIDNHPAGHQYSIDDGVVFSD